MAAGGGCAPRPPRGVATVLGEALLAAMRGPLAGYAGLRVVELGVGRRFVYVVTEAGQVGLAFSWLGEPVPEELLEEVSLAELAGLAWQHPLLTSLALAAANAAMQALIDDDPGVVCMGCDFVEQLGLRGGERVALVGFVPGVARALAERGARLLVYEDNVFHRREAEREGYTVLPGSQLLALPQGGVDAVVATGASLLDPRVQVAVERIRPRTYALVGPTSSFHPLTAARLGAGLVGGSYPRPEAREKLLRMVKAGYGYRRMKSLFAKWTAKAA